MDDLRISHWSVSKVLVTCSSVHVHTFPGRGRLIDGDHDGFRSNGSTPVSVLIICIIVWGVAWMQRSHDVTASTGDIHICSQHYLWNNFINWQFFFISIATVGCHYLNKWKHYQKAKKKLNNNITNTDGHYIKTISICFKINPDI